MDIPFDLLFQLSLHPDMIQGQILYDRLMEDKLNMFKTLRIQCYFEHILIEANKVSQNRSNMILFGKH
jgi:hypothetical protein